MNEETQFAQKISHVLNQTTDGISPAMAARLHEARTHALSFQRQPVAALSLAGIGNITSDLLHGKLRTMVLAFALSIGVVGSYYVNDYMQADENEEVDSALLADDLPINAYLDAGFQLWVDDSSPASH